MEFSGNLAVSREFWHIVRAERKLDVIDLAARDFRMELCARYDFEQDELAELYAQVAQEYMLEPEQMLNVQARSAQMLAEGVFGG